MTTPQIRVHEAASPSEPKVQMHEAASPSEPKVQMHKAASLSKPKVQMHYAARTRAEINKANAQHSTGPKTVEGKAISSHNSFKHGLYSKQLVIGNEEAAELDALKVDLRAQHQPANDTEEILVNEMGEQFWRIRRARCLEASLLETGEIVLAHLAAIQRMMTSAERGFHKSLTTLRQLQKDRGFVPQTEKADPYFESNDTGTELRPRGTEFSTERSSSEAAEPASASPELKANSCSLTATPGFVPPELPADADLEEWAEWASLYDPEGYAFHQQGLKEFEGLQAANRIGHHQKAA
jgi:hypothetical protein